MPSEEGIYKSNAINADDIYIALNADNRAE